MLLSDRVLRIAESATLAVNAKAKALAAAGKTIINLGVGEPDFDTPAHVKAAAIAAIERGETKYTAVDGTPALKQAIVDKLQRENQLTFATNEVLVSCGGKHSLFNLFQALLNAGDEVIIPAPYWVSYPEMALICDAKPVIVPAPASQHFKITASQLQQAITPRTKLFVLNSPSNPTGVLYTVAELQEIAAVLMKNPHVFIVSDDIYERLCWDENAFCSLLKLCPDLRDRFILVNGVSKTYSMTGWRIGYAAGPLPLIKAMTKAQSQSTSNPCSIAQAAAVAALSGDQSFVAMMRKEYQQRHNWLCEQLSQNALLKVIPADGAFYLFLNVAEAIQQKKHLFTDDITLCNYLLEEVGVAVVPGSAFGDANCVRLSFATTMENLKATVEKFKGVFN